ncbi:leucine-rich repeat-containing protein 72 isoform X4 [Archocentrus centrarchus]|uniref:leucine-rich repeat-containing protein 72 isoform X4 n=1 Tax=Archocentrus centrarchus TaxID=63155 RepID=UPI0011EA1A49|nr:leucine-rich repeat-containing protein 72 isoform X4 [Archocentrus centrarchus]
MEATKVIEDSVQKRGIRRDCDVCELRLATKKLTSVPDLSRFRLLRKLRLNNNKIRELSCHSLNCCLTELYLHNNNIKSVSGALSHLTCLQILFLHNNCIRGLEDTMYELRRMQQLQNAKVKPAERRKTFQIYRQDRHRVLQSVAFGRRQSFPQ